MSSNDEVRGVTTGQITVGASLVTGFTAGIYCNSVQLQLLSGGTVSIVGASSLTDKGAVLFPSQPQNFGGPVTLWLQESGGATSVVQFIKTLTIGISTYLYPHT